MCIDCAGIDWLMGKFKAYVILRDRLLTDTSILRDKLDVAVPDFANGRSKFLVCEYVRDKAGCGSARLCQSVCMLE